MSVVTEKMPSLLDLATRCMKEHDNDIEMAVSTLIDLVMHTPEYYETYVLPLVQKELRNQCRFVFARQRQSATHYVSSMASDVQEGYISAIEQERTLLLDFPLPIRGGIRMRDATRTMLTEATLEYQKKARTMMVRRKWFEYVAHQLADDQETVGQVLDERALMKLYKEAEAKMK